MRAAIATFGSEVSPRFCGAREVLLVDVEGGQETGRSALTLGERCNPDRLRLLGSFRVTVLLCGGFNRQFLAEAERNGVHVCWGVAGPVEDAVRALAAGEFGSPCRNSACWCATASAKGKRGGRLRRSARPARRGDTVADTRVVAIACEDGSGLESPVSQHFGHTPFFLVARISGENVVETRTVASPGHGPGCGMPAFVQTLGAQAVVVGGLGPGAATRLRELGVEVLAGVSGRAEDALQAFARGQLAVREATCGGHGRGDHGCRHHH